MAETILPQGTKVKVRTSKDYGIIQSSECKRYSHINNGRKVRFYKVLLENGKEFEYEISDLTIQF